MIPHAQRVLMLVENRPAPSDARVWPEALALRDHGFDVSVISPKGAGEYDESACCIDDIHIYRYALPTGDTALAYLAEYGVAFLMTCWLTLKVWRQRGIDIVHTANPPDIFFPIGLVLRRFGKKFVFDQHDLSPELFEVLFIDGRRSGFTGMLLHKLLLFCERCAYRTADLVIVTNQTFQRIAMGRGKVLAGRVAVIRNSPETVRMPSIAPEPALKMGRRYLLVYIGVMGRQDGVDIALRALDILVHRRGRRDVAMALLGAGAHEPTLRTLAHQLSLDEYIHFTGWVERKDITRYLATADIGLSPDPYNALNDSCTMLKTMEYMAFGKPVVAFDLIETRFTAQAAAVYATPNLVDDFADKIEMLLDDHVLRSEKGALGRKRIEDELSWERSEEYLLRAYAQVLGASVTQTPVIGSATAVSNDSRQVPGPAEHVVSHLSV